MQQALLQQAFSTRKTAIQIQVLMKEDSPALTQELFLSGEKSRPPVVVSAAEADEESAVPTFEDASFASPSAMLQHFQKIQGLELLAQQQQQMQKTTGMHAQPLRARPTASSAAAGAEKTAPSGSPTPPFGKEGEKEAQSLRAKESLDAMRGASGGLGPRQLDAMRKHFAQQLAAQGPRSRI